jgi:hypothetical protein
MQKSLYLTYLFSILLALITFCCPAQVRVKGYYRSNGTYVQPHVRSSPDADPYNNYSYPGNYNPYTGKTASGNEDTYLSNNYDRSSATSSQSKGYTSENSNMSYYTNDTKPDRIAINSSGSYALKYSVETGVTKYHLYNSNQTVCGKMFFFKDGDMCIYDMSNNLLKRSPNTFPDDFNIKPKIAPKGDKMIIGNNGDYGVEYSNDENVNKFYLYHSDNTKYGKVFFFNDGDMCIYDLNNNLISRTKFK